MEDVDEFTYLGSIVNIEEGTDADVKNRINKARVIFNILGKVWSANVNYLIISDLIRTNQIAKYVHRERSASCTLANISSIFVILS